MEAREENKASLLDFLSARTLLWADAAVELRRRMGTDSIMKEGTLELAEALERDMAITQEFVYMECL